MVLGLGARMEYVVERPGVEHVFGPGLKLGGV